MMIRKNNKGNAKALIGVIVLLLLVVVGLSVYIISGRKKDSQNSENKTEAATEASTEKGSSEAENEGTDDKKEESSKDKDDTDDSNRPAVTVRVSSASNWENGGKHIYQFDIDAVNNTKEDIKDWSLSLEGFEGAEVVDGWNATFKIDGNVLTLTKPEGYNEVLAAMASTSFGVQLSFDNAVNASEIVTKYTVMSGGKEVLSAENANEEKTEAAKEEKTEAAKEDKTEAAKEDKTEAAKEDKTEAAKDDKTEKEDSAEDGTSVQTHGRLSIDGTDIVDKNGDKFQLKGVSTHGIAWFPQFVNKEAFRTLRDDWGANLIRLAMYTDEGGGYCSDGDKDKLKKLVNDGVDYATELGMYVIIDWHILHDLTPLKNMDAAVDFFDEMSKKYADHENVIYEICNEPNGGTSWSDIKKYAETVIPVIRNNDKNAIIIVGTPNWSQDVDDAAADPVTGYENIAYTVHFYAATHKDGIRSKVKTAHDKGLCVFISEFSICDASGNGGIDYDSADDWFSLIDDYNLSYAGWSLANKNETSALISPNCSKTADWAESDLSDTGKWLRNQIKGDN